MCRRQARSDLAYAKGSGRPVLNRGERGAEHMSEGVLKRLPSLPKQHALVFGTSVNLPTSFKVREALPRPRSDDTKIVDLWFHRGGTVGGRPAVAWRSPRC
jgi:hypothetical protein